LNELNRRREIHARLRFCRGRMRVMNHELAFALGKIGKLPAGERVPHDWALVAAREAWERVFSPLARLQPDQLGRMQTGDFWELASIYRRIVSFIGNPSRQEKAEEKRISELQTLRRSVAKFISRAVLRLISRIEARFHCSIPAPSPEELTEKLIRSGTGAKAISADGEFVGMKFATARIYYLVWFFWPKLEGRTSAPELHTWLREEHGEDVSDKTVEAIVTMLRVKQP
jgi:hypothetical protein